MERNYQFKAELLKIHKKGRRDFTLLPCESEYAFFDGMKIAVRSEDLSADGDDVIITAVRDFEEYLFTSMSISATVISKSEEADVKIFLNRDIGDASGYMGYRITVCKDGVEIEGYDARGVAQALYYIEDMMNIRRAPYLETGVISRKAMFSPRTVQSPVGMFEYPDAALSLMAHMGFDCIDIWMKDAFTTTRGDFFDLNLLSERAAKYGIDVCVALYAIHNKHPEEEGAQEFYDELYGDFFTACPRIKYISLVGEATRFPSRDPRAGKSPASENIVDNIPTGRFSPGWFPCNDYPQWVKMINDSIHKFNPDAILMLSTYNWGFCDEEDRVKLVENLPEDVAVCSTWDMFEQKKVRNSIEDAVDYSLSNPGPGKPFVSEAKAALKSGAMLYANSQTAGKTWDFGLVPYEPMPGQWIKRFEGMQKAYSEWNLRGTWESIHYGFYPSFICELAKYAFFTGAGSLREHLEKLVLRDHSENASEVLRALSCFDEAITHYVSTNEDQYGAYRAGPAYPLWLEDPYALATGRREGGRQPSRNHAMFGNRIYFPTYPAEPMGRNSLPGVRIFDELSEAYEMRQLLLSGIEILEACPKRNENTEKLFNLAKFICCCVTTAINTKRHYILKQKINVAETHEAAAELLDEVESLLREEKENVLSAIPLVQNDSLLGWEPSMEYIADEKGLRWKLRQLDFELDIMLPKFRKSNNLINEIK